MILLDNTLKISDNSTMKMCSMCKIEKSKSEFYKQKETGDGLRSQCKHCIDKKNKQYKEDNCEKVKNINYNYREKHKEELREKSKYRNRLYLENNPERVREIRRNGMRKYRITHPERVREATAKWKEANPEKARQCAKQTRGKYKEQRKQYNINYQNEHRDELRKKARLRYKDDPKKYRDKEKQWRIANPEKVIEIKKKTRHKNHSKLMANHAIYCNERRKSDPLFKLATNIRTRINRAIRTGNKNGRTSDLIGCSIEELKKYIESQFLPGMSWGNWGLYTWHIDHKKPIMSFDISDPEQQKKCFHFSNLQPLWAKDNLKKRWDCDQMIARMTGK